MCNLINYPLIICSSSYLSLFVFHFFTLKITQRIKITYIYIHEQCTDSNLSQKIQVTLSEQNRQPPKHFSKLVNNNTTLNLKIASYFLNILASPDVSKWFTTVGPITKTIKHIGRTKHHRKTLERTWNIVNWCK